MKTKPSQKKNNHGLKKVLCFYHKIGGGIIINNNSYVSNFPDQVFYKGDTISIPFAFFYPDNSPIDLRHVEVRFYLFPYGQPDMKVEFGKNDYKLAVVSENEMNECTVVFIPSETESLEFAKYTYIPRLFFNDGTGRQYIRGEGHITFRES